MSAGLGAMAVKELIEKLNTLPPDATVKVWNPYSDCESYEVHVSVDKDGGIFILDTVIGTEV